MTIEGIPGEKKDRMHMALRVPDAVQGWAEEGNVSTFDLFRWVQWGQESG